MGDILERELISIRNLLIGQPVYVDQCRHKQRLIVSKVDIEIDDCWVTFVVTTKSGFKGYLYNADNNKCHGYLSPIFATEAEYDDYYSWRLK